MLNYSPHIHFFKTIFKQLIFNFKSTPLMYMGFIRQHCCPFLNYSVDDQKYSSIDHFIKT